MTASSPRLGDLTLGLPGTGAAPHRWSRRVASDLVVFLDVLAILAGVVLTTWLHEATPFLTGGTVFMLAEMGLAAAVLGSGLLREVQLYDTADMTRFPVGPWRSLALLVLLLVCILSVGMSFGVLSLEPWSWFPVWLAVSWPSLVAGRLACRRFFRAKAALGLFNSNVAVFGSGVVARRLHEHLSANASDMALVGVFDDRQDGRHPERGGLKANGTLAELIEVARAGLVDQIIIALPASADRRISEVARQLEPLPVSLHVCTHVASDLIGSNARAHRVSNLGPIGMIDVKRKPLADWGQLLKAVEDAVLGSLFLLLALPVMALIALAIKLDDGGPVLFRQSRRGLNHRPIEVLKFRTMRVAPLEAGVPQATKDDPRVTRVGRWLRRTSLDELPQLVNVLRGEMSLVGPRPHALVHDDYWGEHLERYANRQQVKPGITGWAQVNGFRGETETPEKMQARVEHDLHYIDNWSLWLDLRIIAATPFFGLAHKNAY